MTQHEIECEQALQQIFEYVDHELGDSERTAMERHLHTCESCFSRMEFERRLKQKLYELHVDEAETALRGRIKSLIKSFDTGSKKE